MDSHDDRLAGLLEDIHRAATHAPDSGKAVRQMLAAARTLLAQAEGMAAGDTRLLATTDFRPSEPSLHMAPDQVRYHADRHHRARVVRDKIIGDTPIGDAAWNILLALSAAERIDKPVSITSACYASLCAPTTGIRWVVFLEKSGLVTRIDDPDDGRRAYLVLSPEGRRLIERYFIALWREKLL